MKCFRHQERDAVGLCKSCSKGVCPDCVAEVGNSIACKETCKEDVAATDDMIQRSKITIKAQKTNRMYMPAFFLVLGSIFVIMSYVKAGSFDLRSLPGAAFIFFGIVLIFINRKWVKDMEEKK